MWEIETLPIRNKPRNPLRNYVRYNNDHFTDSTAWELIASKLADGHPVETLELRKPPGARGFVMKIDIEPGQPRLYVKLELGTGKVLGRSFHYSERED